MNCRHKRAMKRKIVLSFTVAAFFLTVIAVPAAQKLSLDVNLTMLRSHVVDGRGSAILDLTADDFEILEKVPLRHFSLDTGTAEIGFLADTSLSMRPFKDDLKQTIGQFVASMNGDRAFLMSFASDAELVVAPTYDLAAITKGIDKLKTTAGSRFYDAVLNALDELVRSKNDRKALIILSDGADHYSSHTFEQLLKTAKLYGCEIYVVGYPGDDSRISGETGRAGIRGQFFQLVSARGAKSSFRPAYRNRHE